MKRIVCICLLAISVQGFAQHVVNQQLTHFNQIKVFQGIEVVLEKSNENKIQIDGENALDVDFSIKNERLKIAYKLNKIIGSKEANVTVFYKSDLLELDANQGSVIKSNTTIVQPQIELSVQEGSYIKLPIKVKYLKAESLTGGNMQLTGTATNQNIEISLGSNYHGFKLITQQTFVKASTGSTAQVYVTDILDANVRLGGIVTYKGKPASVKTTKKLGGKVVNVK